MASKIKPPGRQLTDFADHKKSPDILTTSHGHPVDCKTATLTAGGKGPVLLQDYVFLDEMAHFDRERIPERVVHAKGTGAFDSFSSYTGETAFRKQSNKTEYPCSKHSPSSDHR